MKVKKVKPLFDHIITTMDRYIINQDSLTKVIDVKTANNAVKEYQTVVEVGPAVKDIKVGDIVCINPRNYARPTHNKKWSGLDGDDIKDQVIMKYDFPVITIDDEDYMLLYERDIDFIVEDWE